MDATDSNPDDQLDVMEEVIRQAAIVREAVRTINCLTRDYRVGYMPPDVNRFLTQWRELGSMSRQCYSQVAGGLLRSLDVMELVTHSGVPAEDIELAVSELSELGYQAAEMDRHVVLAADAIAWVSVAEPEDGGRDA